MHLSFFFFKKVTSKLLNFEIIIIKKYSLILNQNLKIITISIYIFGKCIQTNTNFPLLFFKILI